MKRYFSILILFALSSCSHYIVNESGYIRPPKNYKFSFRRKVEPLKDLSLIDITAIYYLHDCNFYRNSDEYKTGDKYIRFYADGRFKLQGLKSFPTVEDVNDPNKRIVGYYYLKGSLLRLQIYSDIGGGTDQLEFGKVDDNGDVILLRDNPRTGFRLGFGVKGTDERIANGVFNPMRYKKLRLEGMTYEQGDW